MRAVAWRWMIFAALALACEEAEEGLEETVEAIDEATGTDTLEGPGESGPAPYRVVVGAASYAYQPSTITAPRGPVRFVVTNTADIVHGFEVEGQGLEEEIAEIQPGSTDSLTVDFAEPGDYLIYCPVDDHRQRGMTGTLTIQ
jgi:uncharacterized cupredoxin-like copper-binding protein